MKTNPKIIFFTDFDGTITLKDSRSKLKAAQFAKPATTDLMQATTTSPTISGMDGKSADRVTLRSLRIVSNSGASLPSPNLLANLDHSCR